MVTINRFISTVYLTPSVEYYIKCVDTLTALSHYFIVAPNGSFSRSDTLRAEPGKVQDKVKLSKEIKTAIVAYLEQIELETNLQRNTIKANI